MSPEYCRPPSPISGTPAGRQASEASWIAEICGTPTPAMTRVVQIDPGPTPTLTASAPASTSAFAPDRVATLPPMTSTWRVAGSDLSRPIMSSSSRAWPFAVSATRTSTPASTSAVARSHASPKYPMAAPTRSRPSASLVARGYFSVLTKSFTVMSPPRRPCSSTSGSFSILCLASSAAASSRLIPTGAVTSGIGVIRSRTSRCANSSGGTNSRSRLVMMPSSVRSLVDDGQAGHPVGPAELVELGERGVGADGHRVGDHAGLRALHPVDLVRLVLDGQVAVDAPRCRPGGPSRWPSGTRSRCPSRRTPAGRRRRCRGSAGRWCRPRTGRRRSRPGAAARRRR